MGPAGANLGRFLPKFLLMVIPGLIASAIVALVLYAIHVSRAPESAELLTDLAAQGDGLSAEERRGLTRQMLRARRENPQEPEQVRPTPAPRPSTTGVAQDPATDPNAHPDRMPAVAPLPTRRPALARARPDAAPPGMPTAPGTTSGALAPPPAVAQRGAESEPQPRSFAANVFSSISAMAGTAANATGNTVNWVIDLPGKAISAGGRLFGGDSAANNPQPDAPPSSAAPSPAAPPPAKRNL
jgi:hypothetical protein